MGLFKDLVEGLASGYASAARAASSVGGIDAVESWCSRLRWGIDERLGDNGIVLHFDEPWGGVRKVSVITGGNLASLIVFSESRLRHVPHDLAAYLLMRNSRMLQAWSMVPPGDDGAVWFALTMGVSIPAVDPAAFSSLCKNLLIEVRDFDAKLRKSGLL